MKNSPLQDHLRGYLSSWQKKYWVLLSGLESGGHLLPLVASFLVGVTWEVKSVRLPFDWGSIA